MKRISIIALLLFFASMTAFGVWELINEQEEYKTGADIYSDIAEVFYAKSENGFSNNDSSPTYEQPAPEQTETVTELNFDSLRFINGNIIGWINGCENIIDYPVVQADNNDYYLNHLVDGSPNRSGSIFIDSRNSIGFADRNTFIYGHNMRNGTMFSAITKYADQRYYDQHPTLTMETNECTYLLEPFSGYVTLTTSDTYRIEFIDDADFSNYIEAVTQKSNFTSEVVVAAQDKIVTLSTCTYDDNDARYVLHCKLTVVKD